MILKVIKNLKETKDVFSLVFEKPIGFSFYPGQYLDYKLEDDTRAFTISASPTEDFLMLSTKVGLSPFKKALEVLKPGMEITTSHPAGTFILDENSPAVFIAGGIGITPFRSMIKFAFDKNLSLRSRTLPFASQKVKNLPITLIYLNSDENFPFKKELNLWQKQLPNLKIIYHNSSQSGHLTKLPTTNYHLPIYYLAGPPKMVDSFEKMLLELGVDKTNIRYDQFDGY